MGRTARVVPQSAVSWGSPGGTSTVGFHFTQAINATVLDLVSMEHDFRECDAAALGEGADELIALLGRGGGENRDFHIHAAGALQVHLDEVRAALDAHRRRMAGVGRRDA